MTNRQPVHPASHLRLAGEWLPPHHALTEAASLGLCILLTSLASAGVFAGIALGMAVRPAKLGPQGLDLLGFPGDIMLRLLKMMVLPLIAGSMIAGEL